MQALRHSVLRPLVVATLASLFLQACGGNGGNKVEPGVNGSYLHISTPDFYFGTRDVGTRATQDVKIANRGADVYTLKSFAVLTENLNDISDEFSTDALDDVVLKPAEAITVGITFQPITDGRKFGNFVVDYDTLQQVAEAVNINEQNYYRGADLENAGYYQGAKQAYSDYIEGQPVTTNKRRAAIKLPVITESETYGTGEELDLYLAALDQRDTGEFAEARAQLEVINALFADGYLADDALYLRGYIQLMDEKDYASALRTMQQLRKQYPDSTYYDTALYSEAIAQQEIGNDAVAREILLDLRYRHTGVEALGIAMAKDNLVSRLWFDRANSALESLDAG